MMSNANHINRKRILRHTLFWGAWIVGFTFVQSFGFDADTYWAWLVYYLITLPLFMAHAYLIAYWLVPHFFFRSRYLAFSCLVIVLLVVASIGELLLSNELIWKMMNPENIQHGNYMNWQNVLINGLGNEYIILIFLSVKVIRLLNSKIIEQAELLNRKLASEIELIRYQSYPRFVLNVIDRLEQNAFNNLPHTSEMIVSLSNLLSNVVCIRKPDKIQLYKELEAIRSYIGIQQLNSPESFKVNFQVNGDMPNFTIPPFLFFQLVEEGFQVLENCRNDSDFSIILKVESEYLLFRMTIWTPEELHGSFSQEVMGNCHKYLNYFYPECHKIKSNFEINFVEISIELYT